MRACHGALVAPLKSRGALSALSGGEKRRARIYAQIAAYYTFHLAPQLVRCLQAGRVVQSPGLCKSQNPSAPQCSPGLSGEL